MDDGGRPRFVVATGIDVTEQREAEAELRRSEEHRRLALEGAELGTWDYDLARDTVFFDERYRAIHGIDAGQMPYPEVLTALVHLEDRARVDAAVRRSLETGELFDAEYRIVRAGRVRWIHTKGQTQFEGEGALRRAVRFVGTVADTTAAREAEEALRESEARFRQLADSMPQVVWTARPDGTVDYYNERVNELSGTTQLPDGTWQWRAVLHPDDAAATEATWAQALRTGVFYECAHRVHRTDGQYHWYLSRGVPVRDASGRLVRWYGTATDIDAQKQAEEALREADQRKTEFLGMLSHELRNPLAPIRNSLYVLDRVPPGGSQARRSHEVIGRQVAHLSRLVDDLLDVTRISRGKIRLQRERMDLREVVRRAVEDHRTLFATAGIDLRLDASEDAPLPAQGDATRIAQVVGNLLANAAKFTPRGGHVGVALTGDGAGSAEIQVADDGAGIPAGLLAKLFEPFVQAEATLDRSKGGLGLGLALVKGLVELHGGRAFVHSNGPGKGATFTVKLPLEPESSAGDERPAGAAGVRQGTGRRVLVIEDNTDAAESLREALELDGHEVAVAAEGQDGVAKARALRPDVVICDIGLPGMNGYEVARTLRADPAMQRTTLVALSGYAQPEDLERSRAAGFFRHLAKPPDLGLLERTLQEARGPAPASPSLTVGTD
ncbi:MAG: PAS domain-containing protein [Myxococcales bacterium]